MKGIFSTFYSRLISSILVGMLISTLAPSAISSTPPTEEVLQLKHTIDISAHSATVGDADGDGQNELLVAYRSGETQYFAVYEYLNGTYTQAWSLPTPNNWRSKNIFAADVDTDGVNELITSIDGADAGGYLLIFEHTGDNNYSEVWRGYFATLRNGREVSVDDADNDGKNELVVGVSWYGRYMVILEHTGGNNYIESWRDNLGSDFFSTVIADADNDGQNEIVAGTADWSSYDVRVYENTGVNSYALSWRQYIAPASRQEAMVGDVDNDGLNEILVTTGDNGWTPGARGVRIFKWDGSTYSLLWTKDTGDVCWKPYIGDILNKGSDQFVFLSGGRVRLYEYNTGNFTEIWSAPVSYPVSGWGEEDTFIGDSDNDGVNELIVSNLWDGVLIYEYQRILPDLSISDPRPVQVVFEPDINDDGKIDLVLGKATAVLTTIQINNDALLDEDELVNIQLTYNGQNFIESRTVGQLRENNQVEFYFTPTVAGDLNIVVKVDPNNEIVESDEDNNETSVDITCKDTNDLYLTYFPVLSWFGDSQLVEYSQTVTKSGQFISATYPVAKEEFTNEERAEIYYAALLLTREGIFLDMLGISLKTFLFTNGKADRGVGIVYDDYFPDHGFSTLVGTAHPALGGVLVEEGYWTGTAHEIGHTYGLYLQPPFGPGEEYNINPPGNPASGYWVNAVDPLDRSILNSICFMGTSPYHGFGERANDYFGRWIERDDYEHLFKELRANEEDPEVLFVNGILYKDGTLDLGRWYRAKDGKISHILPGQYSIQSLDMEGNVVDETSFDAPFYIIGDPYGAIETDISGFAFAIPYPMNTSKIRIMHGTETILELNPNTKLLHDAVDSIPDHGFKHNPRQLRKTLHNKIDEVEIKIEGDEITDAKNKLEHDIKDKLEKWLIDGYQKEDVLQLTKDEVIELVNEIISRLRQTL
jgi:hypothetical protein